MKKRKWFYIHKPAEFEMTCDKCGGSNITWSEYEHMIWCYDCKIDTHGTGGVFDGPIAWGVMELFGVSFARFYIKENKIKYPRITKNHIKWYFKRING